MREHRQRWRLTLLRRVEQHSIPRLVDPDTGTSTYAYDTSSSLVSQTSASGTVSYSHDLLGRVLESREGDTVLTRVEYDAPGNLGVTVSESSFSDGREYRSFSSGWDEWYRPRGTGFSFEGGVVPQALVDVVGQYGQSYSYNRAGVVTSVGYSGVGGVGAETVSARVSSLGLGQTLSSSAGAVVQGTTFSNIGQVTGRSWPRVSGSGLTRSVGYDPLWRVPSAVSVSVVAAGGQATRVADDRVVFNEAGVATSVVDAVGGQGQCFSYTAFSELSAAWTLGASGGSVSCGQVPDASSPVWNTATPDAGEPYLSTWAFDAGTGNVTGRTSGNRANLASPAVSVLSYGAGGHANAVSTVSTTGGPAPGVTSFDYNTAGARTGRVVSGDSGASEALAWNVVGKPTRITSGASAVTNVVYDVGGSRVVRDSPSAVSVYVGDSEFVYDKTTTAITVRRAYSLTGAVVGFRDSGAPNPGVQYSATDGQGSPVIQADPATLGASTGWVRASYTPYGSQRLTGPQRWQTDNKWLNKPLDDATGLTQTDQRFYDPGLQQFISPDPLLDTTNPNPYTYANNNPVDGADPTGLFCMFGNCGGDGPSWCVGTCDPSNGGAGGGGGGGSWGDSSPPAGPPAPSGSTGSGQVPGPWGGPPQHLNTRADWTQFIDWSKQPNPFGQNDAVIYALAGVGAAIACVVTAGVGCAVAGGLLTGGASALTQSDDPGGINWGRVALESVFAAVAFPAIGFLGKSLGKALGTTLTTSAAETAGSATANVAKFSDYVFKEGAVHGKDAVFRSYGYGAGDSSRLAAMYEQQAASRFASGDYQLGKLDEYGQRINITIDLEGQGSAAGRSTQITSGWMIRDGSITLNTPFSGFPK